MNKEYILEVKNLEYTYGDGTHALKGINLKIEKGKKNCYYWSQRFW